MNPRRDEVTKRQVELAQHSLEQLQKAWGRDHERLIGPLLKISDLLFAVGMYAEAEQYSLRLLSVATKNFGPDNHAVGSALQMIGEVCEVQDLHIEAERFYLWALSICEHGSARPGQLTELLARIANLYRTMKQPFKARIIEMKLVRALCSQPARKMAS